ncbi:hypothetical protein TSUD_233130 [Trifolium subterraneum]|uniref:Homeobox domain-containing protein n=1 Tax=Trifolium subterraneum TaxID=3900 RepID=A0A2Z6MMX2_TRISU|nr:hypothetical protein TSUD_233130 [Trifolium subterraneum]
MGIATSPSSSIIHLKTYNNHNHKHNQESLKYCSNSMSQDYQQTIFGFSSNGFERSSQQQQQQQQIHRDKVRMLQGFNSAPLVEGEEEEERGGVYETTGMLSEMFNFADPSTTAELLGTATFRSSSRQQEHQQQTTSENNSWYGNSRQGMQQQHQHQMSNINASAADSAAAMHLFLMNPTQTTSSSSPPHQNSSTLHMLLPNPPSNNSLQGFPNSGNFGQFTSWGSTSSTTQEGQGHGHGQGQGQGQGLSLSLSSSLEAAKAEEELRMRGGGESGNFMYNNYINIHGGGGGGPSSSSYPPYKINHQQALNLQLQGGGGGTNIGGYQLLQSHQGIGSVVNVLRNSKYMKATQELLQEFCSVGRGHFIKKNKFNSNPNNNSSSNVAGGDTIPSSKDHPPLPLSAGDRIEHQRRKVKLLAMLDEACNLSLTHSLSLSLPPSTSSSRVKVDRRYNHYCEQMQMVVNSFDLMMGFGAATPYTALAQKAMSRHFRCLKDAITVQLKQSCEILGEKEGAGGGLTKGETPRLKVLEQSLRQQRAFHQMGMMDQEAWRPQRGLPERSVNVLRAWLFEHFLHPYPSDADKHLLARQTGLSRNQVSNWFINARVRLWKPMVEEMYQQELNEAECATEDKERNQSNSNSGNQTQTPPTSSATEPPPPTPTRKRSDINPHENDPSLVSINRQQSLSENQAMQSTTVSEVVPPFDSDMPPQRSMAMDDVSRYGSLVAEDYETGSISADIGSSTLIRFGPTSGDVSLTLGLRHVGNVPDETNFSIRDFGSM